MPGFIARLYFSPKEKVVVAALTNENEATLPPFALSLVRHGRLAADVLWEIKSGMLKKSGLLTLHRGGESFADLGGLEALKGFCARALRPGRPPGVRARGEIGRAHV